MRILADFAYGWSQLRPNWNESDVAKLLNHFTEVSLIWSTDRQIQWSINSVHAPYCYRRSHKENSDRIWWKKMTQLITCWPKIVIFMGYVIEMVLSQRFENRYRSVLIAVGILRLTDSNNCPFQWEKLAKLLENAIVHVTIRVFSVKCNFLVIIPAWCTTLDIELANKLRKFNHSCVKICLVVSSWVGFRVHG